MGSLIPCVGARCQAQHGQKLRNSWEVTKHCCQLEERRNSWEKGVFRRNLKMSWGDRSMNKWWVHCFSIWKKKKRGKKCFSDSEETRLTRGDKRGAEERQDMQQENRTAANALHHSRENGERGKKGCLRRSELEVRCLSEGFPNPQMKGALTVV